MVTSGGSPPVHYIIHAAALDIDASGDYSVTGDSVLSVVNDALMKARSLGIGRIYLPLIGAGVAGLSAAGSLTAVLKAADSFPDMPPGLNIAIAIYDDMILTRDIILSMANQWQSVKE